MDNLAFNNPYKWSYNTIPLIITGEEATFVSNIFKTQTSWWEQNVNLPQVGVKIKNIWNHHLANQSVFLRLFGPESPPREGRPYKTTPSQVQLEPSLAHSTEPQVGKIQVIQLPFSCVEFKKNWHFGRNLAFYSILFHFSVGGCVWIRQTWRAFQGILTPSHSPWAQLTIRSSSSSFKVIKWPQQTTFFASKLKGSLLRYRKRTQQKSNGWIRMTFVCAFVAVVVVFVAVAVIFFLLLFLLLLLLLLLLHHDCGLLASASMAQSEDTMDTTNTNLIMFNSLRIWIYLYLRYIMSSSDLFFGGRSFWAIWVFPKIVVPQNHLF